MDSLLNIPANYLLDADTTVQNDRLLQAMIPAVLSRLSYHKRRNDPSAPPVSLHDVSTLLADHSAAPRVALLPAGPHPLPTTPPRPSATQSKASRRPPPMMAPPRSP